MRKVAAFMVMMLCLFSSPALAAGKEPVLAFKEDSRSVLAGKTFTMRPTLRNTREKATLTYTSSDEAVATVTQRGVVTGVAAGTATITAVAKTKSGSYAAGYVIVVHPPVTAIDLGEPMTLAPGTRYALKPVIHAPAGAMQGLTFSSNRKGVATVNKQGIITAHGRGTATITARAADGSNVKATVKVTVKNYNIVIRSQQGAVIRYPVRNGAWEISYQTESQAVHPMGNDYHSVRVLPLQPGADHLTISITYYRSLRTRDYNYSIFVAPDALMYPDDEAARQARRAGIMPETPLGEAGGMNRP